MSIVVHPPPPQPHLPGPDELLLLVLFPQLWVQMQPSGAEQLVDPDQLASLPQADVCLPL